METPNAQQQKSSAEVAAQLSLTELGLGSLLHGLHIPFGGHALSINQGLVLCSHSQRSKNRVEAAKRSVEVSCVSAILKCLAPLGNTFGPMLSICMQGMLFSMGILVLGRDLAGQVLGLSFLCLWAFIQPLITYGIIFGPRLLRDGQLFFQFLSKKFGFHPNDWVYLVLFLYLGKLSLAVALRFGLFKFRSDRLTKLGSSVLENVSKSHSKGTTAKVIREMCRPLFLFSLLVTLSFGYLAKENPATLIWIVFRPIALGFIVFLLLRRPLPYSFVQNLLRRSSVGNKLLSISQRSFETFQQQLTRQQQRQST